MSERDIFIAALNESEPAKRAAFLKKACGQDKALRRGIEDLLREQESLGSFLEQPADGVGTSGVPTLPLPTIESARPAEGPGTVIGSYKLLEQIGEGGFGAVFMAEQQKPLHRKVALKILKPGMDSRQVIARFEAERQALAIMDHPNIAKVLDAGTVGSRQSAAAAGREEEAGSLQLAVGREGLPTAGCRVPTEGRPYFVMELVKGLPITEFCDQNQLTPRQRLELFVSVCQAVQHAHQKGIIHRDLKPSNVLVTIQDGSPLVKVIDFGIAKALDQQLTDRTMFTGFAQMVGTPLYMSPEQVALSNVDVDTRSDIYSLGVLLYELLTGTTPFPKERLKEIGYDELRRVIREEEPPKPSTRISTLGQASTTISMQRKSDPRRLSQLFRGELDWIVMKALDKDRNRRYESASAFATDVQRYLNNEAVQACPPSRWYRLRKFARRNKGSVLAASLGFVLLVAGLWANNFMIRQEQLRTEAALDAEAKQRALAEIRRQRAEANFRQAYWAIENILHGYDFAHSSKDLKVAELKQWQTQEALRFLAPFCEDRTDEPAIRLQRGVAYVTVGRVYQFREESEKAQNAFRQGIGVFGSLTRDFAQDPKYLREQITALCILAEELDRVGRRAEANECGYEAIRRLREAIRNNPSSFEAPAQLASILCSWFDPQLRDPSAAVGLAQQAISLAPELPGNWTTLGIAYYRSGQWEAAAKALQEALRRPAGVGNWGPKNALLYLAMADWRCGNRHAARIAYDQVQHDRASYLSSVDRAICAEAAALLGIQDQPTPKAEKNAPRQD